MRSALFALGSSAHRRGKVPPPSDEMAGKGAKATATKSADKDKGKKAGGPVSRSSRAAPQVSLIPPLWLARRLAIHGAFRFGLDAVVPRNLVCFRGARR